MAAHDAFRGAQRMLHRLLWSTKGYAPMTVLVAGMDALLTGLIVYRVPYTEIDFTTYVGQARLFLEGERVYTRLNPVNGTGPCVYPAGHVYVYALLDYLSQGATKLLPAQIFFAVLYLGTLVLVAQLYRLAGAPPVLLIFLALSKRLHSIFVLRLFNDPVAMFFVYGSIYLLCKRRWQLACVVYRYVFRSCSLGLSVKMNAFLFLPGLCVVLFRALGAFRALASLGVVVSVQVLVGAPLLWRDASAYVLSAFDFSRVFLYKWTVNWRFLDEATFLDPRLARALLGIHGVLLMLFGLFRWTGLGRDGLRWLVRRWSGERPLSMTPSCRWLVLRQTLFSRCLRVT